MRYDAGHDSGRDLPAARPPLLASKEYDQASVFDPQNLLREARRQKQLPLVAIPPMCVLDPDGDIVRHLRRGARARLSPGWACYHTELYEFDLDGRPVGIVGCAVGAPFAVLVAEQLFASGCRVLLSITSAGRITEVGRPPYFVLIDRSLRDEGTSYHYLPPADFVEADPALVDRAMLVLKAAGPKVLRGASWTTDAPFRETAGAVAGTQALGILAVEMEAAGLYAFAAARRKPVLCLAHITNAMGLVPGDFDKGEAEGIPDTLTIIGAVIRAIAPDGDQGASS
ncbi:MAG: uridine phosphorylase [Candidatus Rokubacteria bacterium 13_1_40CM_69_27]|nr:MAG: uridine phosphorylase [Candidatus Rokubacteria bacterium 13_1_40CM_69_27]OLC34724.1 MAG: uridine phosphorylase [Candidatus Rokubacteria bacterium 13_1_40CM_4_69_5]